MDNLDSTTRIGIWIPLTQRKHALVDREDYERVAQRKWSTYRNHKADLYYAQSNDKHTKVLMHRFIMGLPPRKPMVDHRDRDGLNNCRHNLRLATCSQNMHNRMANRNGPTKYKGVQIRPENGKFRAFIRNNRLAISLGTFLTAESAARAYDAAARRLFGEFARTNFPE